MPNMQLTPRVGLGPSTLPPATTKMTPAELAALVWIALPVDQDIVVKAGYHYAVLASISKSWYSDSLLQSEADKRGLILEQVFKQGDPGVALQDPDTSHIYVHAIATGTKDGATVPHKSPWPTTIAELVKAWYAPPKGQETAPPPVTAPPTNWLGWGIGLAGAGAVGGVGWWLWHRHRLASRRHSR